MATEPIKTNKEIGNITSTDKNVNGSKLKRHYNKINEAIEYFIGSLYNFLRRPLSKLLLVLWIIILDIVIFYHSGAPNGFRALVAEGTLALAYVTYLQMKRDEDTKIIK